MRQIDRLLERGLETLLVGLLALLALLAGGETLLWLVARRSWAPAAELQAILLAWLTLLGVAHGVRHGLHIGVDVLVGRLPPVWRAALGRAVAAAVAVFGALLAISGGALVRAVGNRLPATGLPAWITYAATVAAGSLVVLFALERAIWGPPPPASEEVVDG